MLNLYLHSFFKCKLNTVGFRAKQIVCGIICRCFNHLYFGSFFSFDFLNDVCVYFLTSVLFANWKRVTEQHVSCFYNCIVVHGSILSKRSWSQGDFPFQKKQGINYVLFSVQLNAARTLRPEKIITSDNSDFHLESRKSSCSLTLQRIALHFGSFRNGCKNIQFQNRWCYKSMNSTRSQGVTLQHKRSIHGWMEGEVTQTLRQTWVSAGKYHLVQLW